MKNKKTDMKNRFADTGKSYAGYFLRFVFCLVLTAAASLAQAQNRNQVSGKVTDKAGEPLIGATVVVVGTTTGATTGADGRFTIGVPAGGELKISYIGYVEQTVKVSAQSVLDIVLEEDSQMLKDVVVIGYGTMEKKSVTSSISSIKGDDLVAGMGGSTIATALQGKIPGLTISGSASPNSSNDFQLRGVASVNASKGPLVIIDGIPGGDMRALNQEDIESVDVLKVRLGRRHLRHARRRRCDPRHDQTGPAGPRNGALYGRILGRGHPQDPRPALIKRVRRVRTRRGLRSRHPTGTRSLPTSFRFRSAIR